MQYNLVRGFNMTRAIGDADDQASVSTNTLNANVRPTNVIGINKTNVGRIAERIVSNELEYYGFRVSDLNKEGTAANADLLAVKDGRPWQIQVKGSTDEDGPWFGYGFCTDEILKGPDKMFNRSSNKSFYKAEIVVLVSVKAPRDYTYIALPVDIAESAAQINLDREFRTKRKDLQPKKPGKVWMSFYMPPRLQDGDKKASIVKEQDLLTPYVDNWSAFLSAKSAGM
jgi:hypothetical protein